MFNKTTTQVPTSGSDYQNPRIVRDLNSTIRKANLQKRIGKISVQEQKKKIVYIQVYGISNFWENEDEFNPNTIMRDLLVGINEDQCEFSFIIRGKKEGICIYLGIQQDMEDALKNQLLSLYPGISFDDVPSSEIFTGNLVTGGTFIGFPTDKSDKNFRINHQINQIGENILGSDYIYCIQATALTYQSIDEIHENIMIEMNNIYPYQVISKTDEISVHTEKKQFFQTEYFNNLEKLKEIYDQGLNDGMWLYRGYYGNFSYEKNGLKNVIKSVISGEDSYPQNIQNIQIHQLDALLANMKTNSMFISSDRTYDPLTIDEYDLSRLLLSTIVNSKQLSVLCSLPSKEITGFYINNYCEFDNTKRKVVEHSIPLGDIVKTNNLNDRRINNQYEFDLEDYTRHALVIGVTGGGKTNTDKSLLTTIWKHRKIPFLVIESAKKEYWELRNLQGFEGIHVYTLGNNDPKSANQYYLNPFESLPGVSLQSHIDSLLSTFKAAFELYPPMPYVLETSVYEVYKDRGWNISTSKNDYGLTLYPTLDDLYDKIFVVVKKLGYADEVSSNIRAALEARIHSLMVGGKGAMLNCQKSTPIGTLLNQPTILELDDIGDDDTKSFVIGMLLVQLYEYRQSLGSQKKLQHILVVEEAHRLLKKVSQASIEGGNSQGKSVQFFCDMLAEIRSYGQGFIITDQIPSKLADDIIKNTNLKIVHRTVAKEDRDLIGNAMNMTDDQIKYLSSLNRGYAAVYSEGDNRPKCVKFPLIHDEYSYTRKQIIDESRQKNHYITTQDECKHAGCSYCEKKCQYRNTVLEMLKEHNIDQILIEEWKQVKFIPQMIEAVFTMPYYREAMNKLGLQGRICFIGSLLHSIAGLTNGQKKQVIANYIAYQFKHPFVSRQGDKLDLFLNDAKTVCDKKKLSFYQAYIENIDKYDHIFQTANGKVPITEKMIHAHLMAIKKQLEANH